MSASVSRRILCIGFVFVVPVPILLLGPGMVPAARIVMLGAIGLAVMLTEGARGAVPLITSIFLLQGLVYAGLFWLLAYAASRALNRLPRPIVAAVTIGVVLAGLLAATAFRAYRSPYRPVSPRANLCEVYR